jgi:hypothetical protein
MASCRVNTAQVPSPLKDQSVVLEHAFALHLSSGAQAETFPAVKIRGGRRWGKRRAVYSLPLDVERAPRRTNFLSWHLLSGFLRKLDDLICASHRYIDCARASVQRHGRNYGNASVLQHRGHILGSGLHAGSCLVGAGYCAITHASEQDERVVPRRLAYFGR